jgi:hypothetical protein
VPAEPSMAVMITAWRRPYYLEPVLMSWSRATGIGNLTRFIVALGNTDRVGAQAALIERMRPQFPCPVEVRMQSPRAVASNGPHRAIAEAASAAFADGDTDFLVFGEEDVAVSSDVLSYMGWAAERFADDQEVLTVVAHNVGGQGWDKPGPQEDADADQEQVRLLPYFNPWAWGTWRGRWEKILEPEWDYECDSGGVMDSGYDWNIQSRILPRHGMVSVVPDASRSQNIGALEGWASSPGGIADAQSHSFRPGREAVDYRLVTGP